MGSNDGPVGVVRQPTDPLPHSVATEESLLGAMMLSTAALEVGLGVVGPGDFFVPGHAAMFLAIAKLWDSGQAINAVSVANWLETNGGLQEVGGVQAIAQVVSGTPASSASATSNYAQTVVDHSIRRRLARLGEALEGKARALADPYDLMEEMQAALLAIDIPTMGPLSGLWSVDDWMARPAEARPPWVIPGLLRAMWRAMFVAGEGMGKTMFIQQIALAVAQGVHPFGLYEMPPARTLVVDLENPEERVDLGFELVSNSLRKRPNYEEHQAWLWYRPAGIDITSRTGRAELERAITEVQPGLLCIGPLYKMYEQGPNQNDENITREVQRVLDDMRVRHRLALLIEHHAPTGSGSDREMRPMGSALWRRWPEYGIKFIRDEKANKPGEDNIYKVDRWRGDRLEVAWPDWIEKSKDGGFPWAGRWTDDRWKEYAPPNAMPPAPVPATWEPPEEHHDDDDDYCPF